MDRTVPHSVTVLIFTIPKFRVHSRYRTETVRSHTMVTHLGRTHVREATLRLPSHLAASSASLARSAAARPAVLT